MTEKVVVAGANITEGDLITRQMLAIAAAMPETVIEGAFKPDEMEKIIGKEASMDIVKKQQISDPLLREPDEEAKSKFSPFLIKAEWIDSRSCSLRGGDVISLYSRDGSFYLGDFEVLFVKDTNDREITDDSGGIVDHIEILTELDEYRKILRFIDTNEEKLLIVQRGGNL